MLSHILPLGFPGGSDRKNLPAMQETCVQSLGWEDPLEKGKAAHSSILAWVAKSQTQLSDFHLRLYGASLVAQTVKNV